MMRERNWATRILSHFGMQDETRIDLNKIARIQGVDVQYRDITEEISGHFTEGDAAIIAINTKRTSTHQRFVLAHCLGHYYFKHGTMPPETYEQLRSSDPREISANRFASELLMPKKTVEQFLTAGLGQDDMARAFDVSSESMGYRLQNLGYEYDREFVF